MSVLDIVVHVDKPDCFLAAACTTVVDTAEALPDENFSMVLVVNSKAVTQLTRNHAEIRESLDRATGQGLAVLVCNNALESTGTKPEELFPQCRVVPAGLVEIVHLQRKGYAYIKP